MQIKLIGNDTKENVSDLFSEENELINVTPELRRELRNIVKDSSVKDSTINANNVLKMMFVNDPQFDKSYVFTINKVGGLFRKLINATDIKMLEMMFKKIGDGEEWKNWLII